MNAIVERRFRTVFQAVRAAMNAANIPSKYWNYAVSDAVHKANFTPTVGAPDSPNATFPGSPRDPSHLLPFGQRGYATCVDYKSKLAHRAEPARYLAPKSHSQYYVLCDKGQVKAVRHKEFYPTTPIPAREGQQQNAALAHATATRAPKTLAQARKSPDAKHWQKAYTDELRRHDTHLRTWRYQTRHSSDHPVPFIVGLKTKTDQDGNIQKYKARIAIRGDRMRPGIDFDQTATSAHMPSHAARRILLAVAAHQNASIQSWDVPGAYMRAPADPMRRQTMHPPPAFDGTPTAPGQVCVMDKAMQGGPDANALWERFRDYWLVQWGWTRVRSEASIFYKQTSNGIFRMEASTDDFLVSGPTHDDLFRESKPFREFWNITIQALADRPEETNSSIHTTSSIQHVGLKLERLKDRSLKLSNPKGIQELLNQNGMTSCRPNTTPVRTNADLSATHPPEMPMPQKPYQKLIGSLRFIADTTHPTITWVTGVLGRHAAMPSHRHIDATKHTLRYLKGKLDAGLVFRCAQNRNMQLMTYSDSDYAQDIDTRKSVTGTVVLLGGTAVQWQSARQKTVSHSSTEAEYIAIDSAARTTVWALQLAKELKIPLLLRTPTLRISDKPATAYHQGIIVKDTRPEAQICVDNTGAIALASARGPTKRTKHLDVRYHYIQDKVADKTLTLKQVPTTQQIADPLTKPVGRASLNKFEQDIGFIAGSG